ncbi:MAG: DUF3060 domain-containing protein [Pyrinomonadaceae bacterium]
MIKLPVILIFTLLLTLVSCDVRSETAKKEMEKFETKPTPEFSPVPTPSPIDPADVVTVDTSLEGGTIAVNGYKETQTAACKKFDRVMVNGDDNTVTIKGGCQQIMVNGDRNQVTAEAALEFVLNGSENTVKYSKYVNGRRPTVTEPTGGNAIGKVSAPMAKK